MNANANKTIDTDSNGQVVLFSAPTFLPPGPAKKTIRRPRRTTSIPPAPPVDDVQEVPEVSVVVPTARKIRTPKTDRTVDVADLGVVGQVREALKAKNILAAVMGFLFGGIIPFATFMVAHFEVKWGESLFTQLPFYMMLGGLVVSAKTVYKWSKLAFNDGWKALGFVVLAEGVMTTSHIQWLCITILAYLIVINGLATGCNLALGKRLAQSK